MRLLNLPVGRCSSSSEMGGTSFAPTTVVAVLVRLGAAAKKRTRVIAILKKRIDSMSLNAKRF